MPGTVASIQIMLERNPGVHLVWVSIPGGDHGSYLGGAIGKNCDNCARDAMSFKFGSATTEEQAKLNTLFPGRFHYITDVPQNINGKPLSSGHKNRNVHRASAYYALWYARHVLKRTWAVKLRSDHLFRKADFLVWFCALQQRFPLSQAARKNQTARIVVPSAGTTLSQQWGAFHMGDFWTAGHLRDLLAYYDIANPAWDPSSSSSMGGSPETELSGYWMRCQHITGNYAKSEAGFRRLLTERAILVHNRALDVLWLKYRTVAQWELATTACGPLSSFPLIPGTRQLSRGMCVDHDAFGDALSSQKQCPEAVGEGSGVLNCTNNGTLSTQK